MRFKLFPFLVLALVSCQEKDGEMPEIVPPEMSVEALVAQANQIEYVGTLPNGQTIAFRPADFIESSPSGWNFAEGQNGMQFSEAPDAYQLDVTELQISQGEISFSDFLNDAASRVVFPFDFALVTTLGELERQFPDFFDATNNNRDWIYVIGVSDGDLNQLIFDIEFLPQYFAVMLVDPDSPGILFGDFVDQGQLIFQLRGSYEISLARFSANGLLGRPTRIPDFYDRFISYNFEVSR
ncbi:MAG: hypothetical protein AAF616_15200 [Bacteroidota bacterium]